jgi:hypothetical protein
MGSKLWIGGHCKSGTTWLKFMVAAMLYRTNRPKSVERLIPTVEKPEKVKSDGAFKVHVEKPPKGKLLYIVRHPVDVCVSGINHVSMPTGKTNKDKYVRRFIKSCGNTIGEYGSWNQGVWNWVTHPKCMWLKYEDLLAETERWAYNICSCVGGDPANVPYALENTSFKAMRNLEKKGVAGRKHNVSDVFYNPKHRGYRKGRMFINRGKAGYAREVLSEAQIEAICKRFAKGMKLVGYEGYESLS